MTSRREISAVLLSALVAVFQAKDAACESAEVLPLQLEAKIPLGDVRGRIDHMAVDLARHRLFVAALGNDSLAVVDLNAQRLDRLIGELPEPQGVGYDPATDTLYVANAGDGSVRLFKGPDLSPGERIELGSDADNIRVDSKAGRVFIGHSDGALAIVDAVTHDKVASAPLKAHPESFQLDGDTSRIFVNVPKSRYDRRGRPYIRRRNCAWPTPGRGANFAMTLDRACQHIFVAFRQPAELGYFLRRTAALSRLFRPAAMWMTSSSIRSATVSTSVAVRASSTCLRRTVIRTGKPRILPPPLAHAPRFSYPNWIACCWLSLQGVRLQPRSGFFGHHPEAPPAAVRTCSDVRLLRFDAPTHR